MHFFPFLYFVHIKKSSLILVLLFVFFGDIIIFNFCFWQQTVISAIFRPRVAASQVHRVIHKKTENAGERR